MNRGGSRSQSRLRASPHLPFGKIYYGFQQKKQMIEMQRRLGLRGADRTRGTHLVVVGLGRGTIDTGFWRALTEPLGARDWGSDPTQRRAPPPQKHGWGKIPHPPSNFSHHIIIDGGKQKKGELKYFNKLIKELKEVLREGIKQLLNYIRVPETKPLSGGSTHREQIHIWKTLYICQCIIS